MPLNFIKAVAASKIILTEGSIIERLKREFNYPLDDNLLNAAMLYDDAGRNILKTIYGDYVKSSLSSDFPLIILTPTWRANIERTKNSNFAEKNINKDAFDFLDEIRKQFTGQKEIYIGGLMGVKGDSYNPSAALETDEAFDFHKWQAQQLADAGVDFLIASTIPSLKEAAGIAKAMSIQNIPYIISFVIRPNGSLLDGNKLDEAIKFIDVNIEPKPAAYLINCVHPANLLNALQTLKDNSLIKERLIGLQGNASDKSPEELDNAETLHADDPVNWGSAMAELNKKFDLKILGGCCGTGVNHIKCLIKNL